MLFLILLLGACAVLVVVRFRSDLNSARRVARSGATIVNTSSGFIEYAERGLGVPLLSIHGAGGGWDQGLANVEELIDDGYRVIAPSRFGYLRTPEPPNASPATQADAHAALLAALGIPRAVVVGISAGAQSAIELALRHPDCVTALVVIVPGTYSPGSPVSVEHSRGSQVVFWLVNVGADFFWWVAQKLVPSVLVRFVGVSQELFRHSSKAERDRVMRVVRSIQPLSLRSRGINLDSAPHLHPLPLEKIAVRTLIISARDDLFNTAPAAEFLARFIPGARLSIYETGGHLLMGRQRDVATLVRAFLQPPQPRQARPPDVKAA